MVQELTSMQFGEGRDPRFKSPLSLDIHGLLGRYYAFSGSTLTYPTLALVDHFDQFVWYIRN